MKTQIKKNGDTVVVIMDGMLDFETSVPLREDLSRILDDSMEDQVPKKIIFNLEKLEFVGSSGISNFVQTLKEFNETSPTKPRYCHVKSEFKRIIKAFDDEEQFEIHETEDRARKSFDQ
jgi:anti-anti-sigma factor